MLQKICNSIDLSLSQLIVEDEKKKRQLLDFMQLTLLLLSGPARA